MTVFLHNRRRASSHGEWMAQTAFHVLQSIVPMRMPMASHRTGDTWAHSPLLQVAGIHLPKRLLQQEKKVY